MKLNEENCPNCKKSKPESKFYPYCSIEHWMGMVAKK